MKFKVGDKVKILSRATNVGVDREEVGKVGVIIGMSNCPSEHHGYRVKMIEICNERGYTCKWNVGGGMIELSPAKGEQLLFNFMKD